MAELWPTIIFPGSIDFLLKSMAAYGPTATSGLQQAVGTDAGFWIATLSDIPLRPGDQVREWRYLMTVAQGGLKDILVGPFDYRQAPRPFAARDVETHGIPFGDGSSFSDGSTFSQSLIRMSLHASAALRATRIAIDIEISGPIRRGMYFSIDDRLYMVASVPTVEVAGGVFAAGQRLSFDIAPPLRKPAAAGANVEFGKPRGLMRFAKGTQGRVPLDRALSGTASVDLVESFDGL